MRSYDIATASIAISSSRKWIDNVVSHYTIPGVTSRARGVERGFSFEAIILLDMTRLLVAELGLPVRRAVDLAVHLREGHGGEIALAGGIRLAIDLDTHTRHIQQRLLQAAESVARPRRGRPPRQADRHETRET